MTMLEPVRKSVIVASSRRKAFDVFTAGFDTWWPRSHHIGNAPMLAAYIEGRPGGRCYTTQTDGTESDWGEVVLWDPPHRFVMAWKITADWKYQPDVAQSSEVEVTFTDGETVARASIWSIATSSAWVQAERACEKE
ncbi:hypothetical protein F183_A05000 [Bryobacterales bacterium F-183]|nr:hypothetical protein F183_A05000 [Bryobacterales bacterium F-183]